MIANPHEATKFLMNLEVQRLHLPVNLLAPLTVPGDIARDIIPI